MTTNDHSIDFFVCECGSLSHQCVLSSFDGESELYICIRIKSGNLWDRIKEALKLIFSPDDNRCEYGDIILRPEKVKALKDALTAHLERVKDLP